MKSSLSLLLALLAPIAFALAAPDQPADAPKADADKPKPTPKVSSPKEKEDAVLVSMPLNVPITGLRIPNRDPSGKLLMMLDAQSAQRINDRNVELKGLKLEIRNNDGTTFHVDMQNSVFNLDTRILASDTPTTIRRDDFVISGDRAEFHTKEKFGRIKGNVKMIIYNSGNPK